LLITNKMTNIKKLVWLPIIFLGIQPYKMSFYFGTICFLLVNLGYAVEIGDPVLITLYSVFALNLGLMFSIFIFQLLIDSIFIFKLQYDRL